MTRAVTIALLISGLVAATQSEAKRFWVGREGLGMGKLGAAGSQGSNGAAPVSSALLINTGSALLINTGSKFLIHN
jgi:hypothetical protein